MKLQEVLSAFALGAAAVVTAHFLLIDVSARSVDDEVLDVCASSEGQMRAVDPKTACPAGEERIRLKQPDLEPPCEKEAAADVAPLRSRVAALEADTDEGTLETATAPFTVTNEAGIVVFSVEAPDQGPYNPTVEMFNETGRRVAAMTANTEGGAVTVDSGVLRPTEYVPEGVSAVSAMLLAFGNYADFEAATSAGVRLRMGRRIENGRYGLTILGSGQKPVAGIGESQGGSGIAMVFDAAGNPRVSLNLGGALGPGTARIIDGGGRDVGILTGGGEAGSGLLLLKDASGAIDMVQAGMFKDHGVVLAGPGAFQHGFGPMIGLPASYIEGVRK